MGIIIENRLELQTNFDNTWEQQFISSSLIVVKFERYNTNQISQFLRYLKFYYGGFSIFLSWDYDSESDISDSDSEELFQKLMGSKWKKQKQI